MYVIASNKALVHTDSRARGKGIEGESPFDFVSSTMKGNWKSP